MTRIWERLDQEVHMCSSYNSTTDIHILSSCILTTYLLILSKFQVASIPMPQMYQNKMVRKR